MKFLVTLEGRRFECIVDDERRMVGFYTSREIEAQSDAEIDTQSIVLSVIDELELEGFGSTARSTIRVTEIAERNSEDQTASKGFTLFLDESLIRRVLNRLFGKKTAGLDE